MTEVRVQASTVPTEGAAFSEPFLDTTLQYDRTSLPTVALLERGSRPAFSLPPEWLRQSAVTAAKLADNFKNVLLRKWPWLVEEAPADLSPAGFLGDSGDPNDINAFAYRCYKLLLALSGGGRRSFDAHLALFESIDKPESSAWLESEDGNDLYFAREPLQGNNPVVIRTVATAAPGLLDGITDLVDDLNADDLYVCDYAELSPLLGGPADRGLAFAPRVIFHLKRGGDGRSVLRPVCVRLGQSNTDLVVTPTDPAWAAARRIARLANQLHHVLLTHLPRSHFFVEGVAVATTRQLSPTHAVRALLDQHFDATFAFNNTGLDAVIGSIGWFQHLLPGTPETRKRIIVAAIKERPFTEFGLQGDLAARGMEAGGPDYLYRDDGARYWGEFTRFLTEYVHVAYTNDAALRGDKTLLDWHRELGAEDGVGLREVPKLETREDLVAILRVIVWAATAGHSAIHNPLASQDVFAPAAPNALFGRAPTTTTDPTMPEYHSAVPAGGYQLALNYFGDTRLNLVGEYDLNRFPVPAFLPALFGHAARIRGIATDIDLRNASLTYPYRFLHPDVVTRSIHV